MYHQIDTELSLGEEFSLNVAVLYKLRQSQLSLLVQRLFFCLGLIYKTKFSASSSGVLLRSTASTEAAIPIAPCPLLLRVYIIVLTIEMMMHHNTDLFCKLTPQ
jgi:hypothetical protein